MKRLLKTTLALVLVALVLLTIALGVLSIMSNTVTLDTNLLPQALAKPVFLASNGEKMDYKVASALSPQDLPQNLKDAFVALEDKRFYKHNGYDGKRILGAMVENIKAGRTKEGASTITQQLIKNTHLSSEKTMSRKLNEVFLATKLEKQYSKDEILAMYLSVIYFGGGIYGVQDAADYYFGKELKELTVAECATLAGIVKNPSTYSPKNHMDKSKTRRNLVLNLMKEQNMIDDDTLNLSLAEPTRLVNKTAIVNGEQSYLKECVREVLLTLNITRYQLENSGLTIYTHYNPHAQEILVKQLKDKSNYAEANIEGAGALIDNDTSGVLAYYSTIPYAFRRQAGSIIKPLVAYAPALERGLMTIASPIEDKKTSFGGYCPANYNDIYHGWTTPREAIKKSMNTVAVKALSYVGSDVGMEYGKKFGLPLNEKDNSLALALGGLTDGVTVLEMAGGYCALANKGRFSEPKFVRYTATKDGDILYANDHKQITVISKENSAILTNVLVDTVKDGTARTLSSLPFMIASKTGTVGAPSQKHSDKPNTDAWNLSYTSEHTLAIWHGASYTRETGGGHPTMTARKVWDSFYQSNGSNNSYPADFVLPETVMEFDIDSYALENEQRVLIAGENTPKKYVKKELFSLFNMPTEISTIFSNITVDNLSVEIVSNGGFESDAEKKEKDNIDQKQDDFDDELREYYDFNDLDNENSEQQKVDDDKDSKWQDFDDENTHDKRQEFENDGTHNELQNIDKNSERQEFDKNKQEKRQELKTKRNKRKEQSNDEKRNKRINDEKPFQDDELCFGDIRPAIYYSFANPYDENDFPFYYNNVKITFLAKEIFSYKIEREINGYRVLIATVENKKGDTEIIDTPPAFNCYATYIVTAILKTETGEVIGEQQSQTIWLSLDWLE